MTKKSVTIFLFIGFMLMTHQCYAVKAMKNHHKTAGLSCSDCHTSKPFEAVGIEQCTECHELPETKDDYHGKPDKHDSPHYGPGLDCENCHLEHDESVNFCNDCHEFDFIVP